MATTLRRRRAEDQDLARPTRALHTGTHAAATAMGPRPSHPEFVAASTERLLARYAGLFLRLSEV